MAEGLCRGRLSPATPGKKEIYENTYQRLDSLEETIRELEMTISEISGHPAVGFTFPKGALGSEEAGKSLRDLGHRGCDGDTALDLSQAKDGAAKSPFPSRTKPALLPKPQLPPGTPQVHFLFSPVPCCALDSLWRLFLCLLPLCDSTSRQIRGAERIFLFSLTLGGLWEGQE